MEASSESIAGDGVADRQREESEPDGQHDEVKHLMLLAASDACAGAECGNALVQNSTRANKLRKCPAGFAPIGALCLFRYCPDDMPLAAYVFE
jgi:hypothetical protein